MLVGALFLGAALQAGPAVSVRCGMVDDQTAPLRSPAGYTAALKVHIDDDHMKNSHLCMAEYKFEVTGPDGKSNSSRDLMESDDDWGRPISARIEGFNAAGNLAYILITEGEKQPSIYAVEYNLKSGDYREVYPAAEFVRSISPGCRATLRIAGTTANGRMALATSAARGCARQELWELRYEEKPGKHGGSVSLDPVRLASSGGITALAPVVADARGASTR